MLNYVFLNFNDYLIGSVDYWLKVELRILTINLIVNYKNF